MGENINDNTIIRSRRKTISLHINDEGELIVRAPYYASKQRIRRFIQEKKHWIEAKQQAMRYQSKQRDYMQQLLNKEAIQRTKKRARSYFKKRLNDYAEHYGYTYGAMRLSGAKTRWGSCSADNTIRLNWKLMFADPRVIDYVVVHELVHTRYKNHQKKFWSAVACIHPSYKEDRAWLKDHAYLLSISS
ncbi:DUF45 domain-containing protein [Candidatus Peregrinibacteria bacterium]|nr:DUF45 domain-containing protein [Candidatus Peregrinibacteria bacterium]